MRRTWIGLLAFASLCLAAATVRADTPDETLARTQALMARGSYREALEILDPFTSTAGLTDAQRARLYQQLAAARSQTGPDDRALAHADEADRIARSIGAYDVLARVESVRGIVWLNRGRAVESLTHFRTCVSWAEQSKQPALVAGAYIRLAAAYQDLGDWPRALDAVNRSVEADAHPDDTARVQYLARRGLVQIELHDGAAAKASIREALDLTRRLGDRRSESQVLIDLALVSERVDRDPQAAADLAAQAVAIAREIHMTSLEIPALNQLGGLLRETGQLEPAHARLTEALAVAASSNEHRDEPYVLKNLGQVLVRMNRIAEGERALQQAAARADAMSLTRVRWLARFELARLHALRNPDAATREFDAALAILEEQQTNVILEGFRAGELDASRAELDPYDEYIRFLLDRGDAARAFDVSERARARAFLETLSRSREEIASEVPAGFADEENAVLRDITAKQAALRSETLAEDRRRDLVSAVDRDEARLTALRLRLATERPALAEARYPTILGVRALQSAQIRPDEAFVSFFLGASRSVCWVMTRDRLTTIPLPPRAEIEARVRAALQQLRDPAASSTAALDDLARALSVDAIAAAAPAAHLVVIPHGILYDVPFEALPGGGRRALVERYAVSYAPSASSLAFFRSLASPPASSASATVLAVGDPVVSGRPALTRQADLEHVGLLTPLPHSADEIRGIAALFPGVRVLRAGDATEAHLRASGIENVRILHFATHGLIDEARPDRSGLVLTASPPDDGLLQVREIYGLRLRADLVTLSACDTALGQNVTGEGMIGLTRAFFFAGARSVVASLWDIEDASTARLMQRFYTNIRDGEPLDVALQHAKLTFVHDEGPASRPFFWAAFIAIGEGRVVVPVPARTRWPLSRAVTLALLLSVIAAAIIGAARWRTSAAASAAARRRTHPAP
jgi:CHAT domain-containing protein